MTTRPRIAPALAGVLVVALLAGCSTGDDPEPRAPRMSWSAVDLPAGLRPTLVTPGPDGSVVVAVDGDPDGRHALSLLLVGEGGVTPIPVRVVTYYGRRVVWHGLAVAGSRLYGFGGRSGGAHGNIRWTAWSGSVADSAGGVREDPQDFETFGGPRGGALSGLAVQADGRPALIGSRVSDSGAGLDVVAWHLEGRTWVQDPSAGSALAASDDQQPAAHAVARRDDGLLVAGSVTTFGPHPRTHPAVWTAADPAGPWTQSLLAADDVVAEAQAVVCDPGGDCLAAGHDGTRLVAWEIPARGAPSRLPLPDVEVGGTAPLLAGSASGPALLGSADPDGRLLLRNEGTWSDIAGPAGAISSIAVAGHLFWVVGDGRLWSAPEPS